MSRPSPERRRAARRPPGVLALALVVGCAADDGALGARAVPPVPPGTVPTLATAGLVFVELGRPSGPALLALVDTGASASAVELGRSEELPRLGRSEVVGTTGSFEVENVLVEGWALGGRPLPALRATRRDLSGLLAPEGRAVDAILGSDAFLGCAVRLDFDAGTMTVGPSPARGSEGEAGVPMTLDNGIPTVPARLGGLDVRLRLDTGASLFDTPDVYVNVPARVWRELSARDPLLAPSGALRGTGADGTAVDLPVVPLPGGRVGPLALERVFLIVQPEAGYFADPAALGFVGNNFLAKLGCVVLDYGAERLHGIQRAPAPDAR